MQQAGRAAPQPCKRLAGWDWRFESCWAVMQKMLENSQLEQTQTEHSAREPMHHSPYSQQSSQGLNQVKRAASVLLFTFWMTEQ